MNDELMQSLRKQLSKKDQIILADAWEDPELRRALTTLLGQRQLQLAQQVLKSSADHYWTVEKRGASQELANITRLLSDNLKKTNNERAAKDK